MLRDEIGLKADAGFGSYGDGWPRTLGWWPVPEELPSNADQLAVLWRTLELGSWPSSALRL